MNPSNTIITGLPRSGTTLTLHLLNKLDNTVALHEPMDIALDTLNSYPRMCDAVEVFFGKTRDSIRTHGVTRSVNVDGIVADNTVGAERTVDGLRKRVSGRVKSTIAIDKPLTDDFLLCIKHLGVFTVILEELLPRFRCFAIIRNPLAVIASWNSVDMPINNGHIPAAERLDPALAEGLARLQDKIDRQCYLLSWFLDRYQRLLPPDSILRYEDIISSGGKALQVINPHAIDLDEQLAGRNNNRLYDQRLMRSLGERLLNMDASFWHFYDRESLQRVLSGVVL